MGSGTYTTIITTATESLGIPSDRLKFELGILIFLPQQFTVVRARLNITIQSTVTFSIGSLEDLTSRGMAGFEVVSGCGRSELHNHQFCT